MSLDAYFADLIKKVEETDVIQNNGKDKNGFYLPTRKLVLNYLRLLKDLHGKPLARDRVKGAWQFVVEHIPPDWLVLSAQQKEEMLKILKD